MARERHLKSIDITNVPELLRIVRQLRDANEPLVLQDKNQNVAIVRPMRRASRPRVPRAKPFTKDDSIWNLKGIGRSGVSDVSENKYKYLSEEYLDTHDE